MEKAIEFTLVLVAVCCLIGCGQSNDHATLHKPKYNEILVEFPDHRYSMEITKDEATGVVTAFLTDAHFTPVVVDVKEVRVNFIIGDSPKTFILTSTGQEAGKPATFVLSDKELATLIFEGWQGDATASVEISGTQYNAKLIKLREYDHAHPH